MKVYFDFDFFVCWFIYKFLVDYSSSEEPKKMHYVLMVWYEMRSFRARSVLVFLSSNVSTPFICSQLRLMDWCEKSFWFFVQSILLCFSLFFAIVGVPLLCVWWITLISIAHAMQVYSMRLLLNVLSRLPQMVSNHGCWLR